MLASDHYRKTSLSLVVCPSTLCGHWKQEVDRFIPGLFDNTLAFSGPSALRTDSLRQQFDKSNLVISTYDVVRNEADFFASKRFNYVVLDEGHVIKNSRSKTAQAIKRLNSKHRLILSGTPIQNTVLELWSLFDFLMPGFLGTEKHFASKYGRPILASREAKCSSREKEAGALAMESLHRQVLPFILRRMKDDVLNDLPPKITQDFYCDLSPIQVKLYEEFAKEQQKNSSSPNQHVFQALQYLRKVCNHPKLVLDSKHAQYDRIMSTLQANGSTLDEIHHSAKLPALKELLLQCGIGEESEQVDDVDVIGQHRALIFFQLKAMIDIVERDLLRRKMPAVTYLRLDGSVPPNQRQGIVDKFNGDASIDVLLLSTSVGGQGLNLTGADTVIFVEHDWNPMKDLQAMDRAHRIGQKKVTL